MAGWRMSNEPSATGPRGPGGVQQSLPGSAWWRGAYQSVVHCQTLPAMS
jgi:hypothetical protein